MFRRRQFIGLGCAAVLGGLTGCTGTGGDRPFDETDDAIGTAETFDSTNWDEDWGVEDWFSNTSNFHGFVVDRTGLTETTITVGAPGNGGHYAFDPPAIRIDTGTTVTWKWSGDGGYHYVLVTGLADLFETSEDRGHTYAHTFDEDATWTFYCNQHKYRGAKGMIVVGDGGDGLS